MLSQIAVEIPEGSELLTVATFLRDETGELTMRIANVVGADSPFTPEQQARALRLLTTGVEAEAIAQRSPDPDSACHPPPGSTTR